tara:strand:- start:215 stop:1975 length:1761 start_codon:yes stop_codon:yes gene_type:complete
MQSQKMTLHNDESNLMSFFEKQCLYEIPIYQRNYKWNTKKITQVLQDFDEILEDEKSVHFFGAMIFYNLPSTPNRQSTYEVIDGQQRITTIFLFLLAYTFVLRKYDPSTAKTFFHAKIINLGLPTANSTLRPSKEDRGQLNWIIGQIVKAKTFEDTLGDYTFKPFPTEKNPKIKGPIKNNFTLFKKYLEQKIDKENEEEKGEKLTELVYKILNACTAVSINIIQRQNGPLIFDALNARQEPVTVAELIKNSIFSRMEDFSLEEMDQLHKTYWMPFHEKFKIKDNIDLLEGYFFPFALINSPNIKKNEVYDSIVSKWNQTSTSEQIIENLREHQDSYVALNGGLTDMYPPIISESVKRIHRAGIPRSTLPFFMQLLKRVENNQNFVQESKRILDKLESFLVRRALCVDANAGLHAIFKRMWQDLIRDEDNVTAENVIKYIQQTKEVEFPSDIRFSREIKTKPIYKNKDLCLFFLMEFDRSLNAEVPEDKDITIEHIMPQNRKNWEEIVNLDEHKEYVDVLGNLVLLTMRSNIVLDNKNFINKKEIIVGKAKFASTRDVFETNNNWDISKIKKRSEAISNWAVARWQL